MSARVVQLTRYAVRCCTEVHGVEWVDYDGKELHTTPTGDPSVEWSTLDRDAAVAWLDWARWRFSDERPRRSFKVKAFDRRYFERDPRGGHA